MKKFLLGWMVALAIGFAQTAQGQTGFGQGIVVLRVDNTSSSNTSSVSLLEYKYDRTSQSSPVQTINVPSSGTNSAVIGSAATTEGILQRSQNANYLLFGGYRTNAGSSFSGVDRVIVRVDMNGNVDTSTTVTAATSFSGGASIRSVASVDGSSYYLGGEGSGTTPGIVYVGSHGAASQTGVGILNGNHRSATIYNNQLYMSTAASTGAAANYARGVGRTNVALPTSSQLDSAVTALFTQASGSSHQFILLDRDASVPGLDTAYVADLTGNQIDKYSFDGASWTGRGSFSASGVNGIAGIANDGSGRAILYFTSASELRTIIDQAAFDADISAIDNVLIATAGTGAAFRGIAPVPEPTTVLGASALGLAGLAFFRRRLKCQTA